MPRTLTEEQALTLVEACEHLRDRDQLRQTPTSRASRVPPAERATNDSLRQQLRAYRIEIARLRAENQELREQLARQLGDQRAAANTSPG